jgi:hypothetical protein
MPTKTILGIVVTGLVLFVFGFLYWGINPLPYAAWNEVNDVAGAQATAARLFPEDGAYFLPGPTNDPEAVKLLETGPSVYVTIDHTPVAGVDPAALAVGLLHNIASALVLVFVLSGVVGLTPRLARALLVAIAAVFIINGSEIIWWQQPFEWIVHQMVYYLVYFALGALVLNFFIQDPETA